MNDAYFTQKVWGIVPEYMLQAPRGGVDDEAIAFVIGVRTFPLNVIRFLTTCYIGGSK